MHTILGYLTLQEFVFYFAPVDNFQFQTLSVLNQVVVFGLFEHDKQSSNQWLFFIFLNVIIFYVLK